MGIIAIILLGLALSIDTFAVGVAIGLSKGCIPFAKRVRYYAIIGFFHFMMPVIGWFVGSSLYDVISSYDHWVAFGLLTILGVKLIVESFGKDDDTGVDCYMSFKRSVVLGFALSIDAIVAGFSLGLTKLNVLPTDNQIFNLLAAASMIGVIAYLITWLGVKIGYLVSGDRIKRYSMIIGGVVLIGIGIKALL